MKFNENKKPKLTIKNLKDLIKLDKLKDQKSTIIKLKKFKFKKKKKKKKKFMNFIKIR